MIRTIGLADRITERAALRAMFEARKHVFVDRLQWDVPVLDGRYEVDQFDDEEATYLVILDSGGAHMASARLLPTSKPALLDTLFPQLCDAPPPHGETIFEITRFCLSPFVNAAERRRRRDELVTGLAQYARARGITAYTGVAEPGWYAQISEFGWATSLLGEPKRVAGRYLTALRIDIDEETIAKLEAAGVYRVTQGDLAIDRAA